MDAWENKTFSTPTLTLLDTLFCNFWVISFIFIYKTKQIWCDLKFEKGEKKFIVSPPHSHIIIIILRPP